MLSLDDVSEIVFGLILNNKISKNAVRPELFIPPYDKGIKILQGDPTITPEELIEIIGLTPYSGALEASKSLNGSSDLNWVQILEKTRTKYDAGMQLGNISRDLVYGDDVDLAKIKDIITRIELEKSIDIFTPLSRIERLEIPFKPSGWEAIDEHFGGIPTVGLITLLGYPGTGKSTAAGNLAKRYVKFHQDEFVAIFSMEMLAEELSSRLDLLEPKITKEEQDRILIIDDTMAAHKVISKASTVDNLGLIIVDFADYLCEGKIDEANMTEAFMTLAKGTKLLRVPILLLAQMNRSYTGGIPRANQVYMSSSAEKASWMFLSIYNPHLTPFYDDPDKEKIVLRPGQAAIVCWKLRGGFRKHLNESPGAITLGYDGKHGFSPTSRFWTHIKS